MRNDLIAPVTPEDFVMAMGVWLKAISRIDRRTQSQHSVAGGLQDHLYDNLGLVDAGLIDCAATLFDAVDDRESCLALVLRVRAFVDLLRDDRMRTFVRPSELIDDMPEEMFALAATEKLSERKGFNAQQFFRKLKSRVQSNVGTETAQDALR